MSLAIRLWGDLQFSRNKAIMRRTGVTEHEESICVK
jgi:hypothetical protein